MKNFYYAFFVFLFSVCSAFAGEVPSPSNPSGVGNPTVRGPLFVLPANPLIPVPVKGGVEFDGTNIWVTDLLGTRTQISIPPTGIVGTQLSNPFTWPSTWTVNFPDSSAWTSSGLVFGSGSALSFPDGSAWTASGLSLSKSLSLATGQTFTNNGTISGGTIAGSTLSGIITNSGTISGGSLSISGYPSSSGTNRAYFTPPPTNLTPTSYNWTAPANVTHILVKGCGGGGGGAMINSTLSNNPGALGGDPGQTAGCGEATIPVTPGNVYSISVGGGGAVGATGTNGNPGLDGQPTTFSLSSTTYATFLPGQGGPGEVACITSTCMVNTIGPNTTSSTYGGCTFGSGVSGICFSPTTAPALYGNLVTVFAANYLTYFMIMTNFPPYGAPGLGATSINGGPIANQAQGGGGFLEIDW